MKAIRLVLLVALVTFVILWAVKRGCAPSKTGAIHATMSSRHPAVSGSPAGSSGKATVRAAASVQAPEPTDRTLVLGLARELIWPLIRSLPSELPHTPGIEAGLAALGPDARPLLAYKLTLLDEVRRCLPAGASPTGSVRAFFHFVEGPGGTMLPTTVELLDSTLPEDQDAPVLACLTQAHERTGLALENPRTENEFAWATRINFPLATDFVYRFVAADGAITQ